MKNENEENKTKLEQQMNMILEAERNKIKKMKKI